MIMENGVVIIGTGHAGVQAAASLREEGFDGRVVLIGEEADLPYHKPPLSKTFIKDAAARPQILRAESFYAGNGIELLSGTRVEALDPARRRLLLAGGGSLGFGHAIVATGARPRQLPIEGGALDGVLALRSLADARAIRDAAEAAADIVILGGGFIGLEMAAAFASVGRRVTVVEAQERILARVVDPAVSRHVAARLARSGVRLLTGTTLARLQGANGHIAGAVTVADERIAAGLLVVGIGVVPNTELAQAAGLDTANGIRIDSAMRTSAPGFLAIGDVANYRHWLTAADVRLESVQNATDQARLAARTIVGRAAAYGSVPWFWSDIGDMKLQMVGLTVGSERQIVRDEAGDNRLSVYHYTGDRWLGIETINRPSDHMLGRRMMAEGFTPGPGVVEAGIDAVKAAFEESRRARA
jgi:3-phenylpropionate/trans-cinnamate dioxygenase ferredoxin reductase subunit